MNLRIGVAPHEGAQRLPWSPPEWIEADQQGTRFWWKFDALPRKVSGEVLRSCRLFDHRWRNSIGVHAK
jgi:hypothetical protein